MNNILIKLLFLTSFSILSKTSLGTGLNPSQEIHHKKRQELLARNKTIKLLSNTPHTYSRLSQYKDHKNRITFHAHIKHHHSNHCIISNKSKFLLGSCEQAATFEFNLRNDDVYSIQYENDFLQSKKNKISFKLSPKNYYKKSTAFKINERESIFTIQDYMGNYLKKESTSTNKLRFSSQNDRELIEFEIIKVKNLSISRIKNLNLAYEKFSQEQDKLSQLDDLNLLIFGDPGEDSLRSTVEQINKNHPSSSFDFAIANGDNFYPHGTKNTEDPIFLSHFEDKLSKQFPDLPIFALIGNHDCEGSPDYQIDYSIAGPLGAQSKWIMPDYSYVLSLKNADLIFFNSSDNVLGSYQAFIPPASLEWLEQRLIESQKNGRMIIVITHHPLLSVGDHGGTKEWDTKSLNQMLNLLKKYEVALHISGHDHTAQYFSDENIDPNYFSGNTHFLNVGNASKTSDDKTQTELYKPNYFAPGKLGYSTLNISSTGIKVAIYEVGQDLLAYSKSIPSRASLGSIQSILKGK